MHGHVHCAYRGLLIAGPWSLVPEAMQACKFSLEESGNPAKQMAVHRSLAKATSGKLVPPPMLSSIDNCNDNSVTADQSNLCGQRTSINADNAKDTENAAKDANNARRYADNAAKAKAEADKEVGGGMQKFQIYKLAVSDHAKRALKRATRWYGKEKDKPGGLSFCQIEKKVKKENNGVRPCYTTIWCYANANIAGMSPLKHGVKGDMPPCVFKLLCVEFESFVCIQQINSCQGKITYKKLTARINKLLRPDYQLKMPQCILLAMAKDLDALTMHIAKDWRVCWMTFSNISIWFDNWEFDLVELGFAMRGGERKVTISAEQKCFIINFDETCISVDGSKGRRGG
jgi:hypothetical protein